jgi:hypothetical protein
MRKARRRDRRAVCRAGCWTVRRPPRRYRLASLPGQTVRGLDDAAGRNTHECRRGSSPLPLAVPAGVVFLFQAHQRTLMGNSIGTCARPGAALAPRSRTSEQPHLCCSTPSRKVALCTAKWRNSRDCGQTVTAQRPVREIAFRPSQRARGLCLRMLRDSFYFLFSLPWVVIVLGWLLFVTLAA